MKGFKGRPLEEVQNAFLAAYEKGLSIKNAAAIAKIDYSTVYNWTKNDEDFAAAIALVKNEKMGFVLGKLIEQISVVNPSPQLIIRILNSTLFKDSEYRLVRDKDIDESEGKEKEEVDETIELDLK